MGLLLTYKDDECYDIIFDETVVRQFQENIRTRSRQIAEYGLTKDQWQDNIDELCASLSRFKDSIKKAKSPIEELFLWECIRQLQATAESSDGFFCASCSPDKLKLLHIDLLGFIINAPVEYQGQKFYGDVIFHLWNSDTGKGTNVIVELDGHDFHEKTKQQAQKDKQRNRLLQMAGYEVLRFTGSEVYKSPTDVYNQVIDFIAERCK